MCMSRINANRKQQKPILGVLGYMPHDFAFQMNLNLGNEWGIVHTIVDTVHKMDDGKCVPGQDPNKSMRGWYGSGGYF